MDKKFTQNFANKKLYITTPLFNERMKTKNEL